ncbi:MAG: DUF4914 family protein, partial [Anaerovorax sp.]
MKKEIFEQMKLSKEISVLLKECKGAIVPKNRDELIKMSFGEAQGDVFQVRYDIEGMGNVLEATVTRCKNGAAVNYADDYMRRRDPDSLVVCDDLPTDKPRFKDV